MARATGSVSYTHLDVYKRQGAARARGISGAGCQRISLDLYGAANQKAAGGGAMSDMFLKGMIGFCFAFLLLIGVSALMERYAPERIWDKLFLPFQSRKKEEREKKEKKASRISRNAFMPEIARTSPLFAGRCV